MKTLNLIRQAVAFGIASMFLTGCETTGDPTQGGLLGWSPAKAEQRSAAYRAQVHRENARLEAEEIEASRLGRKKRTLAADIDAANAELSQMLLDVRSVERSGESALAQKAALVRRDIEQARRSPGPDEKRVRALRHEVNSLREELRLLQQRQ